MKKMLFLLLTALMTLSLCACAVAEADDIAALKISSPGGAPGLALATLAVENPDQYTYLAADTITAEFATGAADFIIAPVNAGAKLYRMGKSTYRLAAVVSWGNLFLASQREDFKPEDINGADITLFGEDTINASVTLYALAQNGITPASVSYLAGAANTQQLLLSDESAIVLTAEPALTAAKAKNERVTGFSVNELYKAATGFDGFPQAGLFVRAGLIESDPELANAYLKLAAQACDRCVSDVDAVAEAAVTLELLPNAKVAQSAIPGCAIRFLSAADAREQVENAANIDLTQFGGELPADDFYYVAG